MKLSADAQEIYDLAMVCGGVEIPTDDPFIDELRKSELCDFGPPRGPDRKWVRMWPKELEEEDRS